MARPWAHFRHNVKESEIQTAINRFVGPDEVAYFAYGSNLCAERLTGRVESVRFLDIGSLSGYCLALHPPSGDGSVKSSLHETGLDGDVTYGACYAVRRDELANLTGQDIGFRTANVDVRLGSGGTLSALVYFGQGVIKGLRAYEFYKAHLLESEREFCFSGGMNVKLQSVAVVPDIEEVRGRSRYLASYRMPATLADDNAPLA